MLQEKLILASASPRRRELLTGMGVTFEVLTADISEIDGLSIVNPTPADVAKANARAKAIAVARAAKGGRWILGADTVVALDQRLFGKPATLEQAHEFLLALSGETHEVITGCALINGDRREQIFHEVTQVTFKILSKDVISRYLTAVHVLDKAGAYALQEHGDWIIEHVEGSHSNVIGLPTEKLANIFRQNGLID